MARASISIRGELYDRLADYCASIGSPISTFVEAAVAERHAAPERSEGELVHDLVVGMLHALRQHESRLELAAFEAAARADTAVALQLEKRAARARERADRLTRVQGDAGALSKFLAHLVIE